MSPRLFLALALILGSGALACQPAAAKTARVDYAPGIVLMPEVLLADGSAPRTYATSQGVTYWTPGMPVIQGDQVKLNVFAATGGAELNQVIVRLDNAKIAEFHSPPWYTVIDTAKLPLGYHMVEVWAQGTGDRPQSSTKTLTFYVAKEMPVQYAVKAAQQQLQGGQVTSLPVETTPSDSGSPAVPDVPAFLKGQPTNENARVFVRAAQGDVTTDFTAPSASLTLTEPTTITILPVGTIATRYAYVLARGGQTITTSAQPLTLNYQRIRLQKQTDTTPGLRSGPITLWVWGIDAQGHPGDPVHVQVMVS